MSTQTTTPNPLPPSGASPKLKTSLLRKSGADSHNAPYDPVNVCGGIVPRRPRGVECAPPPQRNVPEEPIERDSASVAQLSEAVLDATHMPVANDNSSDAGYVVSDGNVGLPPDTSTEEQQQAPSGHDEGASSGDAAESVDDPQQVPFGSITEPAALPAVSGSDFDYVIGSSDDNHFEGVFVRGDVNLVAGYSGSGKSTLLIKWLDEQWRRIPILGRPTFGLPYIVCLEDRSKRSFRRTLKRLGISEADIPVRRIDPKLPLAKWLEITLRIEKVRPAIVLIEGLDLATAKYKDMDDVSNVMRQLGEIAAYHHIAIIGSVGSPKLKKNEDYDSLRSKVIGSTAWGRKAETIILLSREKDTDTTTTMYVLYRHRAVEVISLQFEDGHFVVAPTEASIPEKKPDNDRLFTDWSRTQTDGFTRSDVQVEFEVGEKKATNMIHKLISRGLLRCDSGKYNMKTYHPTCISAPN